MAKEAPSPHEVRLTSLYTKPVFQCLRDKNYTANEFQYLSNKTNKKTNRNMYIKTDFQNATEDRVFCAV